MCTVDYAGPCHEKLPESIDALLRVLLHRCDKENGGDKEHGLMKPFFVAAFIDHKHTDQIHKNM